MAVAITKKEQAAIDALKKVAKIWPETLMLFSNAGSLEVLRIDDYLNEDKTGQYELDVISIKNDGEDRD